MKFKLSVRLDPRTESAVTRCARRRHQTRSAVVREAIAALERDSTPAPVRGSTPWDAVGPLVGVVNSGGGRLSEDTGERFRALVQKKARARVLVDASRMRG